MKTYTSDYDNDKRMNMTKAESNSVIEYRNSRSL